MLKRKLFGVVYLTIALFSVSAAQEERRDDGSIALPPIAETASSPAGFAPAGWRVETTAAGDLNGDGRADAAIVIATGEQRSFESYITRALVVALREADGRLRCSAVSDHAVMDGDGGGAYGDPFRGIAIERGAIVIQHYGGSRLRWAYTHRYRYQDGGWWLIGLLNEGTDTGDPQHFDRIDTNLATGLVLASQGGERDEETRRRPPLRRGAFYELQVVPAESAPVLDGRSSAGEWPGYSVRLNRREDVAEGRAAWRNSDDLSVALSAVRHGDNLYLRVEVTDDEVVPEDAVRLVNKAGRAIAPDEMRRGPRENGYVVEARYALRALGRATLEHAEAFPFLQDGDASPFPEEIQFEASVEVLDVDRTRPRPAPVVISTRRAGSSYSGSIRLYALNTVRLPAR